MKIVRRLLLALVCITVAAVIYLIYFANNYQRNGTMRLAILDAPVTVSRDQLAIPYIHAQTLADALRAQGFITGQDRLYQAQLFRLLALGRLAEVFGERGLANDRLIRVMGIRQYAERQLQALDQQAIDFYQHYIEGLNAYITEQQHEHPLSVKMLGIKPEPWSLIDIITLQVFQAWSNGSNWRADLLNQQLVDEIGTERAQQIAQVTVNPDDESMAISQLHSSPQAATPASASTFQIDPELLKVLPNPLGSGSNAWATGSRKSALGKPIFANSPHLPATTLPGFWHPIGLITPDFRAVGVAAAGSPGIGVGRTDHIAYGATVGGSDGADLYIEQLDPHKPNHYLEGGISKSLSLREEVIKVKDKSSESGFREETLVIRATTRGPLISDHGIGTHDDRALSIRWAALLKTSPSMGSDRLLVAKNIDEARAAMANSAVALSQVVVDHLGGIARISSGRVPQRTLGDGAKPLTVESLESVGFDNWNGLIDWQQMPNQIRPAADWVGTANHRLIKQGYPHQFSKNFASSWRYRRIKQVMEESESVSVDDHWRLINDIKNPMAERIMPYLISALDGQAETQFIIEHFQQWDYTDDKDKIAPTLFQLIYKNLIELTFKDEFSDSLWQQFADTPYAWEERFLLLLQDNHSPWFDLKDTEPSETRDQIILHATLAAIAEAKAKLGQDSSKWQWGKLHTITFNSPVIPGKLAAKWLGDGTHPMQGSGETLNRGKSKMSNAFDTKIIDSVRLVVDMADDEKILAVIPGGTSGRYFDPSLSNQTKNWLAGKRNVIWFSRTAIEDNAVSNLTLSNK